MKTLLFFLLLASPILAQPPMLLIDDGSRPPPMVTTETEEPPLTYTEAYTLALAQKKPLLVWVGGNFCERCVRDSAQDFVHVFVEKFEGVQAPAIVVGVVDEGELIRAGDVTWWIEGSAEFGHIPSVRTVIRQWLVRRSEARDALRARVVAPVVAANRTFWYGSSTSSFSSYSYTQTKMPVMRPAVRVPVLRIGACGS